MRASEQGNQIDTTGGPFARYPAPPAAIYATADRLSRRARALSGLDGRLIASHREALAGIDGLLTGPTRPAQTSVRQNARQVLRAALVGGGCIRYFGNGVAAFDRGVDHLNSTYASAASTASAADDAAQAALIADLTRRHDRLEAALDQCAATVAGMLRKGPNDEQTVLTLFNAGALPIAATRVFPGVDWRKADWRNALKQVERTLPPGGPGRMTTVELVAWLRLRPEVTQAVAWLLRQRGFRLTPFERRVVAAQARYDLRLLTTPPPDGPDDETLARVRAATGRLGMINQHLEDDGRLNAAGLAYVDAWRSTPRPGWKRLDLS